MAYNTEIKTEREDMTTIDVGRVLDMSPTDVWNLARKGILRGKKAGKCWKFKKRDVMFLRNQLLERDQTLAL